MTNPAPGRDMFGARVARFDMRADELLEHMRGQPAVDAVFRFASEAADFSMIWHAANVVRGTIVRRPDQVAGLALALGIESLVVNQGLKRLFRRERPTLEGDHRTPVRRPSTSSFPSGHASAAAFNATILTSWDRRRWPLWWSIAAVVGVSRAHVRIHHASDVIGGAVVGVTLGLAARRVLRRVGRR
jgi:membrane-associated phospholipid phosphatase